MSARPAAAGANTLLRSGDPGVLRLVLRAQPRSKNIARFTKPFQDRNMMDAATLERFQKQLEELEAELREAVEGKTDATAPVQVDSSIGRLSRMDAIQSQQMALGLKARQQQQLLRVQNALKSVANGTYGLCRRCKEPIAIERLDAQPDAVVCVKCADRIS